MNTDEPASSHGRAPRAAAITWLTNSVALFAALVLAFGWMWPVRLESANAVQFHLDCAAFFIRTLGFQIAIGVACASLLAACVRRWRATAALGAVALVGASPTLRTLVPTVAPVPPGADNLRLLSVNLLAWNKTPDVLACAIAASEADVILLQEYSHDWHGRLRPWLQGKWRFVAAEPRDGCFGTAIYSAIPFAQPVKSDLKIGETGNPQQRAVVSFGGREIALYNIHLLPPVGRKYIRINRREFIDLERILSEETLPAAVCGDFNFTNSCAQADRLHRLGFHDALDEGARGPQWTWPAIGSASRLPGLRLDHVYLRGGITCASARVLASGGSDHRPVEATLHWALK